MNLAYLPFWNADMLRAATHEIFCPFVIVFADSVLFFGEYIAVLKK